MQIYTFEEVALIELQARAAESEVAVATGERELSSGMLIPGGPAVLILNVHRVVLVNDNDNDNTERPQGGNQYRMPGIFRAAEGNSVLEWAGIQGAMNAPSWLYWFSCERRSGYMRGSICEFPYDGSTTWQPRYWP